MLESLLQRFHQGDRQALSRLLTLLAHGDKREEILGHLPVLKKLSRIVALTGAGGVGKSTLAGRLIELARRQGQTVAVLACDPRSPLSGGALLGDRFRMPAEPDDGVFIRSLATPSAQGTVPKCVPALLQVLEAFGFDLLIVETVGAGQGDTGVRDFADVVVLLLQPETGDDIQWEKAGLLEVADLVVIHKADLPGADLAEAQLRAGQELSGDRAPPILRVSAKTGEGIEELWKAISACPLRREMESSEDLDLLRLAQATLARWFAQAESNQDASLRHLIHQWHQGVLTQGEATSALIHLLEKEYGSLPQVKRRPSSGRNHPGP
ncbi:MAG: methylmalonyl Co-A mutase-associated GTPase MeaB [Planctomycetes bacterium]|nr:methylmalonyl Co-A mutase-associated GTPase MeaB [Planctomycetota bacterium]